MVVIVILRREDGVPIFRADTGSIAVFDAILHQFVEFAAGSGGLRCFGVVSPMGARLSTSIKMSVSSLALSFSVSGLVFSL